MKDDLNRNVTGSRDGMTGGTIAAIIAAVIIVAGLALWHPWSSSTNSASNSSPSTTTGSASTSRAPATTTAPAPAGGANR
jgi:hypothetical protein